MKLIKVSEETWKKLLKIKYEKGLKSLEKAILSLGSNQKRGRN